MSTFSSLTKDAACLAKSFLFDQNWESFLSPIQNNDLQGSCTAILIPGYLERPGCFMALHQRLKKEGFRVVVYRPSEFFCSIDQHVESLHRLYRQVTSKSGSKVVLVGHSMGGLIARKLASYLWSKPNKLKAVFTVGTPNHGTVVANLGLGRCTQEMLPGSDFLTRLNESDKKYRNRMVCYVAQDDWVVPGYRAASLEGAKVFALGQVGHMSILEDETFLSDICSQLKIRFS